MAINLRGNGFTRKTVDLGGALTPDELSSPTSSWIRTRGLDHLRAMRNMQLRALVAICVTNTVDYGHYRCV